MGAPETTSPKISPELSPEDETQTKENPDSQITEATIEEETKLHPKEESQEKTLSVRSLLRLQVWLQDVVQRFHTFSRKHRLIKPDSQ